MSEPDRGAAGSSREEILGRIRRALGARPGGSGDRGESVAGDRAYRVAGDSSTPQLLARLEERLVDYGVKVSRVREEGLPGAIEDALAGRDLSRLVVPADVPPEWRSAEGRGAPWVEDHGLHPGELHESDGVLTGCALAVAETGTIVLDGGERQGRRLLSLLPDYHLCVVFAHQVVELVPEAVSRLSGAAVAGRPITLISGPSATSDIELSRVEGVHGPRNLQVLLVTEAVGR